jgi:hypothetical protein
MNDANNARFHGRNAFREAWQEDDDRNIFDSHFPVMKIATADMA